MRGQGDERLRALRLDGNSMPKISETRMHDKHNPATCQHCEQVPPHQYRRLWKAEGLDVLDVGNGEEF